MSRRRSVVVVLCSNSLPRRDVVTRGMQRLYSTRRVSEVRVDGAKRALEVTFASQTTGDGKEERFRYPAEYLRVYSPAAAPRHRHSSAVDAPPVFIQSLITPMNAC